MRPRTFLLIPLLALLPAFAADKKAVFPEGANPAGPFSPAIIAGGTIYVSGQVGRDAAGKTPEVFEDEVKQTLENIGVILKKAGYDFSDAVAVQVYLTDMDLFQRMNAVYLKYFPEPRPARTTVGVTKLAGAFKIEITVTAWKKQN
jgi:2-iminobutanoate/2-iminopropanoate deaminase